MTVSDQMAADLNTAVSAINTIRASLPADATEEQKKAASAQVQDALVSAGFAVSNVDSLDEAVAAGGGVRSSWLRKPELVRLYEDGSQVCTGQMVPTDATTWSVGLIVCSSRETALLGAAVAKASSKASEVSRNTIAIAVTTPSGTVGPEDVWLAATESGYASGTAPSGWAAGRSSGKGTDGSITQRGKRRYNLASIEKLATGDSYECAFEMRTTAFRRPTTSLPRCVKATS